MQRFRIRVCAAFLAFWQAFAPAWYVALEAGEIGRVLVWATGMLGRGAKTAALSETAFGSLSAVAAATALLASRPAEAACTGSGCLPTASQGQTDGINLMRSAPNPTINTGKPPPGGSNSGTIYLQEFFQGADGDFSKYDALFSNPESMRESAMQGRRDRREEGCSQTSFAFEQNALVARITVLKRTLVSLSPLQYSDTPTTATVPIQVNFPTIGATRTFEEVIQEAKTGVPGLVVKYELVPFSVGTDGSYFTTAHRLQTYGSGSYVWNGTNNGRLSDGFTSNFSLTSATLSTAEIFASLYRVDRTYTTPPQGGCPADPQTCVVSGINFCQAPNQGVYDVFQRPAEKQRYEAQAMYAMDAAMANPLSNVYTDQHAEMQAIYQTSKSHIDGKSTVFQELFGGCYESSQTGSNTRTIHHPEYHTCYSFLHEVEKNGCNAKRVTNFIKVGTAEMLRIQAFVEIRSPLIDPVTGQQGKDGEGNLLWKYAQQPEKLNSPITFGLATIGASFEYDTPKIEDEEGNRHFLHYTISPFSAYNMSGNPRFTYNHRVEGPGNSGTIFTYGNKSNGWSTEGAGQTSNSDYFSVWADLYEVPVNMIDGCDLYLKILADGYCVPREKIPDYAKCTENRTPCTTIDGVTFCQGQEPAYGIAELLPTWGPSASQIDTYTGGGEGLEILPLMCWQMEGKPITCEFADGVAGCYESANAGEICVETTSEGLGSNLGDPNRLDNCAEKGLLNNPACRRTGFGGAGCVEGAAGIYSGVCYAEAVVFDCGEDVVVEVPGGTTYSQVCNSPIRCLGTECHNIKPEQNADFTQVVAAAEMMDFAAADIICAESGEPPKSMDEPCTPLLFSGAKRECKVPIGHGVGLTQDCCALGLEAAAGVSALDYLMLVRAMYRAAQTPLVAAGLAQIPGYSGLVSAYDIAVNAWTSTVNSATSAVVNLMQQFGYSPAATAAAENTVLNAAGELLEGGLISQFEVMIMQYLYDALSQMGMEALAQGLFQTGVVEVGGELVSDGVVTGLSEGAAAVVAFVNYVYIAYMVLKILLSIIFKCEKDELAMGIDRKMGNCTKVGDYCAKKAPIVGCLELRQSFCCYKTPLSRIIAEQIRHQGVAGGFGSARNPRCVGFGVTELEQVNWAGIDLSEWEGMLLEAGIIPNNPAQLEEDWGISSSTSKLSMAFDAPGPDGEVSNPDFLLKRVGNLVPQIEATAKVLESEKVCYYDNRFAPWYGTGMLPAPEEVILPMGGNGAMKPCGEGCIDLWLGSNVDNNLGPDWCTRTYDQFYTIRILRPELIQSALIEEGEWDDHVQITIGNSVVYTSPNWYTGPCELNRSWCLTNASHSPSGSCNYPNNVTRDPIDVTPHFTTGGDIKTNVAVKIGDVGEGYVRVRIRYGAVGSDPSIDPANCLTP